MSTEEAPGDASVQADATSPTSHEAVKVLFSLRSGDDNVADVNVEPAQDPISGTAPDSRGSPELAIAEDVVGSKIYPVKNPEVQVEASTRMDAGVNSAGGEAIGADVLGGSTAHGTDGVESSGIQAETNQDMPVAPPTSDLGDQPPITDHAAVINAHGVGGATTHGIDGIESSSTRAETNQDMPVAPPASDLGDKPPITDPAALISAVPFAWAPPVVQDDSQVGEVEKVN